MRDNKYKIMELFLYIIIVIIGLALLLFGKAEPARDGGAEPPPAEIISTEGGEPIAALHDEQ